MFNDNKITEKTSSGFSYLIRPITPCIFGTENYDELIENNVNDDDEFFITAGGIIHSCPNIYELAEENDYEYRKLQSCDHFRFIPKTTTTTSINKNLNTYDTKFDRYSILPRFQPISSLSIDSMNSEIELYRERHANGLSRKYNHLTSFFPTTWKSDNYLLFMSFQSPFSHKRSRSSDIPFFVTM